MSELNPAFKKYMFVFFCASVTSLQKRNNSFLKIVHNFKNLDTNSRRHHVLFSKLEKLRHVSLNIVRSKLR